MKVKTIKDHPDTEILIQRLNRYTEGTREGRDAIPSFSVGRSGMYYHFSRKAIAIDCMWTSWEPSKTDVNKLIYALTCPDSDLPRLAIIEPDYNVVSVRFAGQVKVTSVKGIMKEIAIARLQNKL